MSPSGEERDGILACLDHLTAAFHHAQTILNTPTEQHELLVQQIEEEKGRGLAQFGRTFVGGDDTSLIALQHITIQLQGRLLTKLIHSDGDRDRDGVINNHTQAEITPLSQFADSACTRTLTVLHDLEQRLKTLRHDSGVPAITPSTSPHLPPAQPSVSLHAGQTVSSEPSDDTYAAAKADDAAVEDPGEADLPHHRKRSHFLNIFKHHRRSHSYSDAKLTQSPTPQETPRRTSASSSRESFRAPLQPDVSSTKHTQNAQAFSTFPDVEWKNHSEGIWGVKPSLDRSNTVALAPDQPSSTSSSTPTGPSASSPPLQTPSPVSTTRSNSNAHHTASLAIPTPNSENNFLGFCGSAVKIQNGDRKGSMSKSREVEAWSRHQHATPAMYLACTGPKCAFRSALAMQDPQRIWTKVFSLEPKGMKVRWQFLAKSHVLQKVVVKHQYSFLCLFCTFLGEKRGIYHGMDAYLQHVNAKHRGQPLSEIALYKTGCIADRIASDDEEFDINLWPLSAGGKDGRKQSEWSGTDLANIDRIGGPGDEANGELSSAEPWNEGLSDFHTGTEFDGGNEWTEIE